MRDPRVDGFSFGQPPYFGTSGDFIMTKFVRLAALAAATTLAATPALAVPPGQQVPGDPVATATARIIKPLLLEAEENLDFGASITVYGPGTIEITPTGGTTCGPAAEMTCDFTGAQPARYRVKGANNSTVTINASPSTLTSLGGDMLAFTPTAEFASILLNNSGSVGSTFRVGGEITVDEDTPEGVYVGDMDVTVNY